MRNSLSIIALALDAPDTSNAKYSIYQAKIKKMMEFNTSLALYWLGFFSSFSFVYVAFRLFQQLPQPLLPIPLAIILFLLIGVIPYSVMTKEFDFNEIVEGSKRGILSGFAFLIGMAIGTKFL
jgi:hypothetical protein